MSKDYSADYSFSFQKTINAISASQWSDLISGNYPFISYSYLCALEASGCVKQETGWIPQHLTVRCEKELVAILPLYIKFNSYGEYVFDFQWANAYYQNELNYYPKLLSAIPFTPCVGPRLLVKPEHATILAPLIVEKIKQHCSQLNLSSFHLLFDVSDSPSQSWISEGLQSRVGLQYHWYSRGEKSFTEFLSLCSGKRRKNINRERNRIANSGITSCFYEGADITRDMWDIFFEFYQITNLKKNGSSGYLNRKFFALIALSMPQNIVMLVSKINKKIVSTSLFFKDQDSLYGRYWGTNKDYEFLHFESCYYQGIDYCINHGLTHFDAGAQGEHKIPRGFVPIKTYSQHWIRNDDFRQAIGHFLVEEKNYVEVTQSELTKKLPYKNVPRKT